METLLTHYSTSALNNLFWNTCKAIFWCCVKSLDNFGLTGVFVFRSSISREKFGPGTGAIVFGYMNCGGSETSLQSCSGSSSSRYCSHDGDVGVWCDHIDDSG